MKKYYNRTTLVYLLVLSCVATVFGADHDRRRFIGIFEPVDQRLDAIRYGNWGSRPYEYWWAASIMPSLRNNCIIDLGVGLPSQYNWYEYVVNQLQPHYYVGVDFDGRMKNEVRKEANFEMVHMNMTILDYPDSSFDIAYCISTFEHLPYADFMASIKEAHRVLKSDSLLIITLDEEWDKNQPFTHDNGWNTLEKSLIDNGLFVRKNRSFGLPEFMYLIRDYFELYQDDACIDTETGTIYSTRDGYMYYNRINADFSILNSGPGVNSCVSYAVLKKK